MNKPWMVNQLEDLMFLLCGVERPKEATQDDEEEDEEDAREATGTTYEPNEKELELLRQLAGIVLDGSNVNKGALKDFEKKCP